MMNGPSTAKWRPTVSASTSEDEATRDKEDREFELDDKGESANYPKCARKFEKDLDKAHASL